MNTFIKIFVLVFSILFTNLSHAYPLDLHDRSMDIANEAPRPWFKDLPDSESVEERKERLEIIVAASIIVSSRYWDGWHWGPKEMLALLLATSYEEGWRWHVDVHSGKKRGDRGKAACLNQLHRHYKIMPKSRWRASMGTDLQSTVICMEGAARWFGHYSKTCVSKWQIQNDIYGAFTRIVTGYGTGRTCSGYPKWAQDRAYRANRWLKELN